MAPMRSLATILVALGVLHGAVGGCLYLEPATVTLSGTLVSHQGLRGWWAVKLDKSICTVDAGQGAYSGIGELQLILNGQADFDRYRPLLNQGIFVTGKLTPGVWASSQTKVMITVEAIKSASGKEPPAVAPPKPLPDKPEYLASVTVIPRPVNRVFKLAWDKDSNHPFPESERYIQYSFNGPMDLMWVSCRDGYKLSPIKPDVFPMNPNDPKNLLWGVAVSDTARTSVTVRCTKEDRR